MPTFRRFARLPLAALLVVPAALSIASVARAQSTGSPDAPKAGESSPTTGAATPPTGSPPNGGSPSGAPKTPLIPPEVNPSKDLDDLQKQGAETAQPDVAAAKGASDEEKILGSSGVTFADEWWKHTRPIVEIHGFFRTRAELFHNFSLGRVDAPSTGTNLFPRPLDDTYTDLTGNQHGPGFGGSGGGTGGGCGPTGDPQASNCTNKTNASANMRFRIDPEIHISDNLRILSQIDMLDNVVMGSTPDGWTNVPQGGSSGSPAGYLSTGRGGYVPLRAFSTTQVPPTAGVNSWQNSVAVKRVWGEFTTPVGQIRFGRMPSHWGLGILANSGDRIDSDWQSTADRILFVTGSKALDLYVAGAWDFVSTGRLSSYGAVPTLEGQGQPYNTTQLENVAQWVVAIFRRVRPEIAAQTLAKGGTVINGGLYSVYRQQILSNESATNSIYSSAEDYQKNLVRVGAKAFIPDLWLQILTRHVRWETEAVYIYGSIENPVGVSSGSYVRDDYKIRQFGAATELEYKALNDDLHLKFYSGLATGDQGALGSLSPGDAGLQARVGNDKTVSTFRFHPDYRIDLILWRNILTRVQGAYYFSPGVAYDFTRSLEGEKFGGAASVVWSRASKPIQAPGHRADLGVELDLTLYYQSKDGSLNDDPSKLGGFFAMLQYGVLFPMAGLGYPPGTTNNAGNPAPDTSTAQTVRLFLGIAY